MVDKKVKKVRNVGIIVIRGRERTLYEGSKGGLYYRNKNGKVYVDKKVLRQSSQKKKKVVAKKKNKFGYDPPWNQLNYFGKEDDELMEFGWRPYVFSKKRFKLLSLL